MGLHAPINGIFFDAGWTLFYPKSKNWLFPDDIINPHSFAKIPGGKRNGAIQRAFKYLDDNHLILTEEEEAEQFTVFYSMISADLPELAITKQTIDALIHAQIHGTAECLFDDTVSTLQALQGKYKLGVISDNWPSLERRLKNSGIDTYFSTMTISSYLGTFKPDKRMYLHALEQMNLPPEQTVFIDDGVENLGGAAQCGIQPVLITAKPDAERSEKYPNIGKLPELLEILPE